MAPACAFHDLNVCVAYERREEALRELHKLGYSVVAFTTVFRDASELTAERCPSTKTRIWTAPTGGTNSKIIKVCYIYLLYNIYTFVVINQYL